MMLNHKIGVGFSFVLPYSVIITSFTTLLCSKKFYVAKAWRRVQQRFKESSARNLSVW